MTETAFYEVILVPSEISPTRSDWTWRRLEPDGGVAAQGLRHDTMKACFAAVRAHMTVFGEAKITVNLRGEAPTSPGDGAAPIDRSRVIPAAPVKRRVHCQVALRH